MNQLRAELRAVRRVWWKALWRLDFDTMHRLSDYISVLEYRIARCAGYEFRSDLPQDVVK